VQHSCRVVRIGRLAERRTVEIDDRIGRHDRSGRCRSGHDRAQLGTRVCYRELQGRDACDPGLLITAGHDLDVQPKRPQQLQAPR
jgi:hypothetical protein